MIYSFLVSTRWTESIQYITLYSSTTLHIELTTKSYGEYIEVLLSLVLWPTRGREGEFLYNSLMDYCHVSYAQCTEELFSTRSTLLKLCVCVGGGGVVAFVAGAHISLLCVRVRKRGNKNLGPTRLRAEDSFVLHTRNGSGHALLRRDTKRPRHTHIHFLLHLRSVPRRRRHSVPGETCVFIFFFCFLLLCCGTCLSLHTHTYAPTVPTTQQRWNL
jgi:hypothetical protein